MRYEERAISFACGEAALVGILSLPAQASARGVVIVVGGPQVRTGSHRQFTLLARALAAAGTPVLRFDYRGMGDSEGAVRDFESVDEDVRAAIDRFQQEVPGLAEVVLWGLCDGAAASALYAPQDARVRGLVLLNPWVRTDEGAARATLKHYYRGRLLDAGLWKKLASGRFDVLAATRSKGVTGPGVRRAALLVRVLCSTRPPSGKPSRSPLTLKWALKSTIVLFTAAKPLALPVTWKAWSHSAGEAQTPRISRFSKCQ